MSETAPDDTRPPYFHQDSGALRFWVDLGGGTLMGASISAQTLHYRFKGELNGSDAATVYEVNRAEIDAAVRRRAAKGSIEPVMLREPDLPQPQAT